MTIAVVLSPAHSVKGDPVQSPTNQPPPGGTSRAKQVRDRAGTAAWLKGYLVALDDVILHLDQLHTEADLRAWLQLTIEDTNTALRMVVQENGTDD